MIDVERESADMRARSEDLAGQLDAAVAEGVVDRSGIEAIEKARVESRRLAALADAARDAVIDRIRRGLDPGCPLGRKPPIRRLRRSRDGKPDDDPILLGRVAVTDELVEYHRHDRDRVGPAVSAAYGQALAAIGQRPALEAACREHLVRLRRRGSLSFEGGVELEVALHRLSDVRQVLGEQSRAGQDISTAAQSRLDQLAGERAAAVLGDHAGDSLSPMVLGRLSVLLDAPVDGQGRPVGAAAKQSLP